MEIPVLVERAGHRRGGPGRPRRRHPGGRRPGRARALSRRGIACEAGSWRVHKRQNARPAQQRRSSRRARTLDSGACARAWLRAQGGVPEWPIGTALKAVAGRDVSRGFESRPLCWLEARAEPCPQQRGRGRVCVGTSGAVRACRGGCRADRPRDLLRAADLHRDRVVDQVVDALPVVLDVVEESAYLAGHPVRLEPVEQAGPDRGDAAEQLASLTIGGTGAGGEPPVPRLEVLVAEGLADGREPLPDQPAPVRRRTRAGQGAPEGPRSLIRGSSAPPHDGRVVHKWDLECDSGHTPGHKT